MFFKYLVKDVNIGNDKDTDSRIISFFLPKKVNNKYIFDSLFLFIRTGYTTPFGSYSYLEVVK